MNEKHILERRPWSSKKKLVMALLVFILIFLIMSLLYVLVIPFHTCSPMLLAGSWKEVAATSETTGIVEFGSFTMDVSYDDFFVLVYVNQTASGYLVFPETGMDYMVWVDSQSEATAYYFDYHPNGGTINTGDYIEFEGLQPNTHYYFELFHLSSYSTVSMIGNYSAFATGPEPPQLNDPSYDYDGTFDLPEYNPPPRPMTTGEICRIIFGIAIIADVFMMLVVVIRME